MPYKSQISDYEPLKRSGSSSTKDADSDGDDSVDWKPLQPAGSARDAAFSEGRTPAQFQGTGVPTSLHPEFPSTSTAQVAADGRPTSTLSTTANDSWQRSKKVSTEPKAENWIFKHGHSVSYVGLYLFTALVYFRPYELIPSLSWLSSSAFWVALATLAVYVVTQLGLEGKITARPREINLALLLLVTGLLSIPLALEPLRAWNSFSDFLKVVLIFIVLVNVVRTEKRLKRLWLLVLTSACVMSIFAIYDYWLGRLSLGGVRVQGIIGGLFENPNDLALHLVTMIPIALALALKTRNPFAKVVYLGCAVLIIGGVVSTFSRGGFLALAFSMGMLMWKLARRSRGLVAILAAVLIVLFMVISPSGYGARLSTTQDASALARLDDLKRSIFVAVRHPVFGVGMDNYILFSNFDKASHNAYTQVASEMGVAAIVFYILFMVAPFKRLRTIERESYETKANRRFYYMAICLQASLAGYMVASFFASVAYLWYIFYLVAYAVCLRRIYEGAKNQGLAPTRSLYESLNMSPKSG